MIPDIINAVFEMVSGLLIWLSVAKLYRDKIVRGVHLAPIGWFLLWGFWNLFYYPHLNQWWSFFAGINVVAANGVWWVQMLYYLRRERRGEVRVRWTDDNKLHPGWIMRMRDDG